MALPLLIWPVAASAGQRAPGGDLASAADAFHDGAGPAVVTGRADLEGLRDEVDELRRQLTELSSELRALRRLVPDGRLLASAPIQEPVTTQVPPEMLQAQVEELAQTKVQSSSRFPVTLSGTIVSNTVMNSGDANWLESPNLVGTASGGSMTSTMRQSRLGLEVQGHTDSTGSAERNRQLSLERAQRVAGALALYGVDPARLEPRGFGPDNPVADNATDEGRRQNRRVELVRKN